ncbi:MAG: proline dehydrogenase family protein [Thermomicrobiales bacterium]
MTEGWFRRVVTQAASQDWVEDFIRQSPLSRRMVERFVAGETRDEALKAAVALAAKGMTATLDHLGEEVTNVGAAQAATHSAAETLRALARLRLQPNVSVKLTTLGLNLDERLAFDSLSGLLAVAAKVDGFVRVDMEGSAYTGRTLDIVETLHADYPSRVGTVIQAALLRSERDVERLIEKRIRVRLVKGAYAEPSSIALQDRDEIELAFARLMERLLEDGIYPAIATHDDTLIRATRSFSLRMGLSPQQWEFQMLYGVRRAAQQALADAGYRMRIYVPFGTDWYPYFSRRIAERPSNALFVVRQLGSR